MSDSTAIRRNWPPETVDLAYRTWLTVDRNAAAACRQLLAVNGISVPETTMYRWADEQKWGRRAAADLSAVTQLASEQHVQQLQVAAAKSVAFLSSVRSGSLSPDTPYLDQRIRAAIHLETAARSLLLQQSKVDGRTKRKPPISDTVTRDISRLDSTELEQYEQELRDKRDSG